MTGSDPKTIAPAPTEGDLSSNNKVDVISNIKDVAPTSTEGDLEKTSSVAHSGPVNHMPTRDATAATSAAQQTDNIAHALSGAGGGLIAMSLTYPLITLSTRAQVESKKADTSTIEAIRNIIDREGISGLYAGLDSALFGISVTNFVYYYWYEWSRSFFERRARAEGRVLAGGASPRLTTIESMAAGAIAGSATVMCTNPIWVVNTRMTTRRQEKDIELEGSEKSSSSEVAAKKRPSTIGTLVSLIKDEGVMSLFAGVLPALVLVINPIIQYTFFEQMRNRLEKRRKAGPRDAFVLGAISKALATILTYPYITVKSRAHVAKKGEKSEGLVGALGKIVRDEGYGALYKGIVPKVSQSVLTAAFLFAFKDILYDYTVAARKRLAAKA